MQASALELVAGVEAGADYSLALHHPEWHGGVVGILASRLKDRFHRPVFAFAADSGTRLKGSGRSIPGFHLRDALDRVDKACPGLLERFGGHAGAAGATLAADRLPEFRAAFEAVAREWLTPSDLQRHIETDGELAAAELSFEFARLLREQVWGQGFPEPRFEGAFRVEAQKVVGDKHVKLTLSGNGRRHEAIRFGSAEPLPASIRAVFRLDLNDYQGTQSVQLVVEHAEAAG
jgi:single-stranded-DNA-specific exonuclease